MTAGTAAARLHLPPTPESAAEARLWVTRRLEDSVGPEVIDTATLLVSEVVTNAVLHAGTEIELGVEQLPGAVRIEVADRHAGEPGLKHYEVDAATGRGLLLVEALAAGWGVTPASGGKIVWFELSTSPQREATATGEPDLSSWPDLDEPSPEVSSYADPDGMCEVLMAGLPTDLFQRCSAQYDAVMREFRLIAEREPHAGHAPTRLTTLADELSAMYSSFTAAPDADLRAAQERGDPSVDLHYTLPRSIGPAVRRLDGLLDEADSYCRAGRDLLSLEPSPAAVAVRKWFLLEFARQAEGEAAIRWSDSDWARQAQER